MRDCSWVPSRFPKLQSGNFNCTSDRTDRLPNGGYNCIAWAVGKKDNWWWPYDGPEAFWPVPIDLNDPVTIQAFVDAFATEGYAVCDNGDYESGFEKLALYVDPGNEPTHAARQLPNNTWTSKLGEGEDIEHETPWLIEGSAYGKVKVFFKRKNDSFMQPTPEQTV